jgi:argininosuccinate lyase
MSKKALWGGRFREPLSQLAFRYSSSIHLDGKLWKEDIEGSLAHVEMLAAQGILTKQEGTKIASGLKIVAFEIETGKFKLGGEMEDIHLAIEQRLTKIIGPLGGKLHTGRSRNDQVALDERLYLQSAAKLLQSAITGLQRALLTKAKEHLGLVIPGYTHMQRAQPVLLSHHLLAYVAMLARDAERISEAAARANKSPLGAAAFAGTSYPIDRERVAKKLGFSGIVENSVDAVSDRDYIIEFASDCSITMMHLSRMAEELVLWSTREFNFVHMSDRVTTGSSIMPQKKNPDMAELVRGKTGKVYGALINLLTIMKGLPLAYNRDMQEDKQPMFDMIETTSSSLDIMAEVIRNTTYNVERLTSALKEDYLTATELADYLVRKGLPFREAHEITGNVVAYAVENSVQLDEIPLTKLRSFSRLIGKDVYRCLDPEISIALKRSAGSTSLPEVKKQIAVWSKRLK